ncbi:hypothetical protein EOM09_06160, partial [bacterium]|nr:hypothetical protein [bacterium]
LPQFLMFLKKIKIGFLCLVLYWVVSLMNVYYFSLGASLLIFVFGSYLLDISLEVKFQNRINRIEKDLYRSVSLLKASFEAGKTMIQAVNYFTEELDGPLQEEFIMVKNDINHGLSLEESFLRMSNRYDIKDLNYIYTSLALVNKTGNNIQSILEMVDKELRSRQELKNYYNSSTSSVRLMYKVLVVFPFILSGLIILLEPTYFNIFVQSNVGILLLLLIFLLYVLYIMIVNKIFKVVLL